MVGDLIPMNGVAESVLANLAEYAEQAKGAFSRNTERAIKADTAIFTSWCIEHGRSVIPAQSATVADFVRAMSESKAPATVRRYCASIAHMHVAAKQVNPCKESAVKLALRKMHIEKGRAQAQAAPLNRKTIDKMLDLTGDGLRLVRNKALLSVGYDSLCRRSELVALQIEDLDILAGTDGSLTIKRSKTDQEGQGMARYLAADTVELVQAWLKAAQIGTTGPLFRAVNKSGRVGGALHPNEVARAFKSMAGVASIGGAARISGHSTRIGSAQDMLRANIEMPAIMASGGWKSPAMPARYTAKIAVKHSGAAKLAERQGRGLKLRFADDDLQEGRGNDGFVSSTLILRGE